MPDYKKLYLILFNAISDAIGALSQQNFGQALEILQKAQIRTEAMVVEGDESGKSSV